MDNRSIGNSVHLCIRLLNGVYFSVMKLEEVKTKEEFINYTRQYGTHVEICIFDYLSVRRLGNTYKISFYKEKHRTNWYNDTKIEGKEIECTAQECFDMIINEIRRQKLEKLRLKKKYE